MFFPNKISKLFLFLRLDRNSGSVHICPEHAQCYIAAFITDLIFNIRISVIVIKVIAQVKKINPCFQRRIYFFVYYYNPRGIFNLITLYFYG